METFENPPAAPAWRLRRSQLNEHLAKHGSISSQGLASLGFTRQAIARLLQAGVLVREHRASYRSAAAVASELATLQGVLVAAGPRASLARVSAAHHQGYVRYPPPEPQIIVPTRHGRARRNGFRVHKSTTLTEAEIILVRGARCTNPPRTIVDLAAFARSRSDFRVLTRALREATFLDPTLPEQLTRRLATRPFRGCRSLEAALALHRPETLIQRSDLESRFLALCLAYGLPTPETNQLVLGFEVDVLFRLAKVIVELDTYMTHGGAREFENDRIRDAALAVGGYRWMRVTPKRLDESEAVVMGQLGDLIDSARA